MQCTAQRPTVVIPRTLGRLAAYVAFLVVLVAAPASAASQQQNANAYARWNLAAAGGMWNVDQNVQIRATAPSTYWAGYWQWTNSNPSQGGYFGLQEDGVRFDGSRGTTAIFSIWASNGARGPGCGMFDGSGEGRGYSCRIAYPIFTDRMFRLRLWRQETDASGQWWGAWIKDQVTGVETSIGGIRAPLSATVLGSYGNFTEYFGPAVPAKENVPRSIADYTQPAANQQSPGMYSAIGSFSGSTVGSGTVGAVGLISLGWTNAARITIGGPSTAPRIALVHYGRDGAVRWAAQHWNDKGRFTDDCTNFVSSAMHTGGGLPTTSWWKRPRTAHHPRPRSWTVAQTFANQMIKHGWMTTTDIADLGASIIPSAQPGDIIWWHDQANTEEYTHVALVVRVTSTGTWIDQHTDNRHLAAWNKTWLENPSARGVLRARLLHVVS